MSTIPFVEAQASHHETLARLPGEAGVGRHDLIRVSGDPSGQPGWPALKACARPVDLYLVCQEDGAWRIVHRGHRAGSYATPETAFAYAGKLAKESAGLGYPSAVFKPADPSAFQGFLPHVPIDRDQGGRPALDSH